MHKKEYFTHLFSTCSARNVVEILDEKTLVFDPDIQDYDDVIAATLIQRPAFRGTKKEKKHATYHFDRVYGPEATSEDVFRGTTFELVEAMMEGYNCSGRRLVLLYVGDLACYIRPMFYRLHSIAVMGLMLLIILQSAFFMLCFSLPAVFAYGATSSGKTFTMLGSDSCPGIAYYTAHELFRRVAEGKDHVIYDVKASYIEVVCKFGNPCGAQRFEGFMSFIFLYQIYNENIYDLLNKTSGTLDICESGRDRLVITPLSVLRASSPHELLQMMRQGNAARTQHPTELNAGSSRSHAVFLVSLGPCR